MWRVVLGYSVALLNHVGEDGVWRPPGGGDIEVLVAPPVRAVPEPREHTLRAAMDAAGWDGADCYLHCLPEYYPLPPDAFSATRHLALGVCDWNVAGRVWHLLRDHVDAAVCDHAGAAVLGSADGPPIVPGLLWGWDAASWDPGRVEDRRDIDVLFVGSRNQAIHPRRERWLARLGRLGRDHRVQIYSSVYGAEYRRLHERAKLVFNHSVRGEANMRSFEAAVAGACVLNERGNPTLGRVYTPDVDYATYGEDDLEAVVKGLLVDDARRLGMARAGQRTALAHSYDVHWASILRDLRAALPADPAPRAPEPCARALGEQWRMSSVEAARTSAGWVARQGGASSAAAERVEALATLGGPPGLVNGDWATADRALAGLARERPGSADAAVALARAETAVALGQAERAVALADEVLASPVDAPEGLTPTRFDPWQMALEAALLDAPGHAARASTRWAHTRARWLRAAAAGESAGLDLDGFEDVVSALITRAEARLSAGMLRDAVADLEAARDRWPLDAAVTRRLADVLAASGRPGDASAVLLRLAEALAGFPAEGTLREEIEREAAELAGADVEAAAWCWAPDLGGPELRALVALRALGAVPADRLVIACPDEAAADRAAAAAVDALRERGVDPADLPDTEIALDPHPPGERWRRLAGARIVVARPGSPVGAMARSMGRPVLTPGE